MPYTIVKDGDQFCVHKRNEDNSTGDKIACHDDRDGAEAQIRAMHADEQSKAVDLISWGGTVKALGDGRIGGYAAAWGNAADKDLQGEYFAPDTDFMTDDHPLAGTPVKYQHGLDKTIGPRTVGKAVDGKADETGLWVEAQLKLADDYERAIYKLAQDGKLSFSTGAWPQSVVVETGKIKRWGIIEISLTPTPAQPVKTRVQPLKSFLDTLQDEDGAKGHGDKERSEPARSGDDDSSIKSHEEPNDMTKEDILALVGEAVAEKFGNLDEAIKSAVTEAIRDNTPETDDLSDEQITAIAGKFAESYKALQDAELIARKEGETRQRVTDVVKGALNGSKPQSKLDDPAHNNGGGGLQVTKGDLRYYDLEAQDMVAGMVWLNAAHKSGLADQPASEDWQRATAEKLFRELNKERSAYGKSAYEIKASLPFKADEVFATNLSNNGANWVGQAYETQLWETVREAPIYQRLLGMGMMQITIPQGFNSVYIPTEGNDPVFYSLAEQNDLTGDERLPSFFKSSNPTANRRQVTPGIMGARVQFTDIMSEDSLIPVLPFMRSRMEIQGMESLEYVIFQGDTDTTASTNINLIDGTPSVDAKGRGPKYLTTDGIFKLPLVTTTTLSRDGGAFDETDFLETWKLLPAAEQVAMERLLFVVDPSTYMAALNITAFKTHDVFNPATLERGMLSSVYGIDVVRSGHIGDPNTQGKTNSAGKISGTATNNTKGRLLLVRPDQWAFVMKRQMRTEVARDIEAQATIVVSSMRFAIQSRTTSGGAAVTYNLTV